jgi:pSer/pThr/pTyr-binding forkhead associated (FHA) protein
MARLTLRSVGEKSDKKEHVLDAAGATLGRDAQEADIVIADKSVSKRHARVFLHKGTWMLEDLGSSNGTHLGDGRITGPVTLKVKMRFSIGVFTYEVTAMDPAGGAAEEEEPLADDEPMSSDPNMETRASRALPSPVPAKERSNSARKAATETAPAKTRGSVPPREAEPTDGDDIAPPDDEAPPPSASSKKGAAVGKDAKPAKEPKASKGGSKESDAEEPPPAAMEGDPRSVKFYLAALPRGIAYHMANVPLLALNPMGTIRKSVEKMPLPDLPWAALIVYALPANLFSAAVTFICTLIMQLVSGTLSLGSIIPVVPLVVALAVSVVGGLACHPVLTWVVTKLKGESTGRQRSNYFVLSMSAVAVLSIPSGLAILLAAVRLPFIGVLPILLSLVGTALNILVAYRWFTAFNVVKWFRTVILVLGVLAALGAAKSLVETVIAGVKSLGSSSSSSSPATPDVEKVELSDEAKKEKAEALEKAEKAREESEAAAREKEKEAAKDDEDSPRKGKKGKKGKGKEKEAATKEDEKEKEAAPEKEKEAEKAAESSGSGGGDYGNYLEHRDAMEKAIQQNPRLLKTVPGLLSLYEKYHRLVFEIRNHKEGGGKKKAPAQDPALEPVRQRLKDIEVYEKTQGLVEELLKKTR